MSPLPAGYRIVDVAEARKDEFLEVDRLAFAFDTTPETDALVPLTLTWDRDRGVESTRTAPSRRCTPRSSSSSPCPARRSPCSGLTWVGARPDQRRRGLLHAMIDTHFERSLARGEPVSALFAAEHAIYGRFGYGSACRRRPPQARPRRRAARRARIGRPDRPVRHGRRRPAHARRRRRPPGGGHRAARAGSPATLPSTSGARSSTRRRGATAASRCASRRCSTRTAPPGRTRCSGARRTGPTAAPRASCGCARPSAVDAAAAHRLWSFLLDLDLMATVESPMLPADDPLLLLLVDQRGAEPRLNDNVWVRLLDLPVALAGRRYSGAARRGPRRHATRGCPRTPAAGG